MALLWRWLVCRRPCRIQSPLGLDFLAPPSRSRRPEKGQAREPWSTTEPRRKPWPGRCAELLMPPCIWDIGAGEMAAPQWMSVTSAASRTRGASRGAKTRGLRPAFPGWRRADSWRCCRHRSTQRGERRPWKQSSEPSMWDSGIPSTCWLRKVEGSNARTSPRSPMTVRTTTQTMHSAASARRSACRWVACGTRWGPTLRLRPTASWAGTITTTTYAPPSTGRSRRGPFTS